MLEMRSNVWENRLITPLHTGRAMRERINQLSVKRNQKTHGWTLNVGMTESQGSPAKKVSCNTGNILLGPSPSDLG